MKLHRVASPFNYTYAPLSSTEVCCDTNYAQPTLGFLFLPREKKKATTTLKLHKTSVVFQLARDVPLSSDDQ